MKVVNSLGGYFEALYELNRNLIAFCGTVGLNNYQWTYQKYIHDVICTIPQLVPYTHNKCNDKDEIIKSDGLIEFSDELPELKEDYQTLLDNHYEFLKNIKLIRNKFEHKMHKVFLLEAGYGSFNVFDLVYKCDNLEIVLQAVEFVEFTKDLNLLFYKIQKLVETYAYKENKQHFPYYQRLLRYKFSDFNEIYDSALLQVFAKAFLPF